MNGHMSTKCGLLIDFDLLKTMTSTNAKPEIVFSGRHLEKSIWPHITAVGSPIWTKFCSLTQNNTAITVKWSKMKPEVEFKYGGRLFFQSGCSYISAVNWGMWTNFFLLIDFGLLKAGTSTNTKPEVVVVSGGGCHLKKSILRYIITGSAVALHCVKAHRQSQWRSPNFNPL